LITNFSTSSVRTGIKRKRFWDQSAVANSFFSIETITLGSAQSSITFSNIPQTYTHLQIRTNVLTSSQFSSARITFNSDTASNYSFHNLYGNGASATSDNGVSQAYMYAYFLGGTSNPSSGVYDILDYKNTNKYKTWRGIEGIDANGSGYVNLTSGNWRSTSAITSITFTTVGGVTMNQYSKFCLYGVLA
jgi:hypothetical protein